MKKKHPLHKYFSKNGKKGQRALEKKYTDAEISAMRKRANLKSQEAKKLTKKPKSVSF